MELKNSKNYVFKKFGFECLKCCVIANIYEQAKCFISFFLFNFVNVYVKNVVNFSSRPISNINSI